MANFTFSFQNIALFVHRPNGLTVLLPSAGHTAQFHRPNGSVLDVTNHVIMLLKDGQRLDERTTPAKGTRLVHMEDLITPPPYSVKPVSELTSNGMLSARVELGGQLSSVIENPPIPEAGYESMSDVIWQFGGKHAQMLTNSADFILPLAATGQYQLRIEDLDDAKQNEVIPIVSGTHVAIVNVDPDKDQHEQDFASTGMLEEFEYLYELVRGEMGFVGGPLPYDPDFVAHLARVQAKLDLAAKIAKSAEGGAAGPARPPVLCMGPACPMAQARDVARS